MQAYPLCGWLRVSRIAFDICANDNEWLFQNYMQNKHTRSASETPFFSYYETSTTQLPKGAEILFSTTKRMGS